ncbi:MAG: GNAT family N-acetyltransferase, partial [Oscillospiraceae bacterium]|nr:GNAT family N-acetyltransferase [Oscillospiraceae bacterium]
VNWRRAADLRGAPLSPKEDRAYYEACYADAWRFAHGDLEGFAPEPYFDAACGHLRVRPDAVLRFYDEEHSAGLLDLDPLRGKRCGYGWISLLYLEPAYRGKGCGVQLLARAYSMFRADGRRAVRLNVADDNETALAFYLREGFRQIGSEDGGHGRLMLMEKKLGVRDDA